MDDAILVSSSSETESDIIEITPRPRAGIRPKQTAFVLNSDNSDDEIFMLSRIGHQAQAQVSRQEIYNVEEMIDEAGNQVDGEQDNEHDVLPSFNIAPAIHTGAYMSAAAPTHVSGSHPGQPTLEMTPELSSKYTALVLEVIPDVDPEHVATLIGESFPLYGEDIVEYVLHILFEDTSYPKFNGFRGRKRRRSVEDMSSAKKFKVDYADSSRPFRAGKHYPDLALEQLRIDFPYIPKRFLRKVLEERNNLYAPTYFHLSNPNPSDYNTTTTQARSTTLSGGHPPTPGPSGSHQTTANNPPSLTPLLLPPASGPRLPYIPLVNPYRQSAKGKARLLHDDEFSQEVAWVQARGWITGAGVPTNNGGGEYEDKEKDKDKEDEGEDDGDCEDGIECGCCFGSFPFEKMVQCPETHLFCKRCITSHVSTLLGGQGGSTAAIPCIHQSGCTLPIPPSELRRILPAGICRLWERVSQRRDLEPVVKNLAGWEECPFCDWGCVMEVGVEEEKLLRCINREVCGAVSCRTCKELDHLPKNCKEAEEAKTLDGRHSIEEAMTQALMRKCPKCSKPFIKESGCNAVRCPECGTTSCYACRRPLDSAHSQNPLPGCLTVEAVQTLHAREVREAHAAALEKYKREHPDVDEALVAVVVSRPADGSGRGRERGPGGGHGSGSGHGGGQGWWYGWV